MHSPLDRLIPVIFTLFASLAAYAANSAFRTLRDDAKQDWGKYWEGTRVPRSSGTKDDILARHEAWRKRGWLFIGVSISVALTFLACAIYYSEKL
jgi:hypothetical protein